MLIGSSFLATTAVAGVVLMLENNNRAHPAREQSACTKLPRTAYFDRCHGLGIGGCW